MKFLLVNNLCITDTTAGVVHSLRTIMRWLAQAGHQCRVLTTARFETAVPYTIDEHLNAVGLNITIAEPSKQYTKRDGKTRRETIGCRVASFDLDGLHVTMLLTTHNDETRPDRNESSFYLKHLDSLLAGFRPDHVIACNSHPMIGESLRKAQHAGATTSFAVRGYGYYDRAYFAHVNHAFTCSAFLTEHYRQEIGLVSTPLEPPIEWENVQAPSESRAFVTFVHPAPHKGLMLFARLADMLGSRRPDIPILIVQSGRSAGQLNAIPGIDFTQYPQIMVSPGVARPAEFYELTRLLLVPSVWHEPFGRVAAEAMINGIPALVSDRGALPQVIAGDASQGGAGRVLPVPDWLDEHQRRLPTEQEIQPWFDAVCELWDNPALYATLASRGQTLAHERYHPDLSRRQHLSYFTNLPAGTTTFTA